LGSFLDEERFTEALQDTVAESIRSSGLPQE